MGTDARDLSLSIVIPVLDEAGRIGQTIAEARAAATAAGMDPEVIVVDDGSTDGSGDVAEEAGARVVRQPNRGRFEARRVGLEAANGEYALLLDARVRIDEGALAFVVSNLDRGTVWNAHALIETDGNAYARFWDVVSAIAFARYFDEPRTTSYGPEEFDAYPKGTTCFFAPRRLLLDAFGAFTSRYADARHANDDTPLIRWIAERERIWISPEFTCLYRARSTFAGFVRHAFHRGIVFVDGHGRRESRYRYVVWAFYPLSAAFVAACAWRPGVLPGGIVALVVLSGAVAAWKRVAVASAAAFAALAPVYATAHGLGMWRALTLRRR